MKTHLAGALAAALIAGASGALAQTSTVIVAPPSGYIVPNPQQQVLVQRYVVGQSPTVVTMPSGYQPAVGTVVPQAVELRTFTPAYDYGGFDAPAYRYVVTQDAGTLLVEPDTRRVIQVIR